MAFAIGNFSTTAVTLHLIPYMVAHGRSAVAMAAAIGSMGAMQIPGRLLFVAVTRRFGALGVTMAVFLAQAAGLGLVALAPSLPGGLFLMIAVLGAANGMGTLARATTLAEVFGPAHYASMAARWPWAPTARGRPDRSAPRGSTWRSAATAPCSGRWPAPWVVVGAVVALTAREKRAPAAARGA